MARYRYEALVDAHRYIRLVKLCPATNKADALAGSISHHSLDNHPSFSALSYNWSHDDISIHVTLDNAVFSIGPNLAAALRHIRHAREDRLLWIDAICVNQKDEEERSKQVQLMPWVFGASEKVIAWLGEATFDSDLALQVLDNLDEGDVMQMAEAGFKCPRWVALKNIWSRSFWKRIWIVQELALGGDRVIAQCGDTSIARPALERAFKTLQSHLDNPLTLLWEGLECEMDWFMNQLAVCCEFDEAKRTTNGHLHLENLLDFTGHFLATDDRDHIYALLGISNDAAQAGIEPDYSKCLEQVWSHTVKQLVENKRSIRVLYGNRSPRDPDVRSSLSSWMPAFGDRVRRGYGWRQGFQVSSKHHAAGAEVSKCGRILTIKGYLIDHIEKVEGPFENVKSEFLDASSLSRIEQLSMQAFSRLQDNNLRGASETAFVALLKTLTANLDQNASTSCTGDHDPSSLQKQLEGLLRPVDSEQCIQQRMKDLTPLLRGIVVTLRYRCFFTTKMGFVGVGPYDTKKEDLCVALVGGEVPFILRHDMGEQVLVGDCYVHGIMDGELAGLQHALSIAEQLFVLH